MVHDAAGVFANQIRLNLLDRFGARERPAFEDWFTEANQAGVGVDLQKEPARLD